MDLEDRRYPETPADFGYNRSALKLWNFTASAPASAAASIRRSAMSKSPLWLLPASATMKHRSPRPTHVSPIRTLVIDSPRQDFPRRTHCSPPVDEGPPPAAHGGPRCGVFREFPDQTAHVPPPVMIPCVARIP